MLLFQAGGGGSLLGLQLRGTLRQFLLGHAGLASQSFFLRFGSLHPILQLLDLSLTRGEVLVQMPDRSMRLVRGVAKAGHYQESQQQKKPLTGVRLRFHL